MSLSQLSRWLSWPPAPVEHSSTDEAGLTVQAISSSVVLVEQRVFGESTTVNYRFTHTTRRDPELARTLRLRHDLFFVQLSDFSGGAVKQPVILGKVLNWELVPLRGRSPRVEARRKNHAGRVPE